MLSSAVQNVEIACFSLTGDKMLSILLLNRNKLLSWSNCDGQ